MNKFALPVIACLALMGAVVPGKAAQAGANMVVAQVDLQVGPNGVRIGRDRDRDRDRFDDRRRGDRFEGRRERRVIVEPRERRCRTVIERRETPYGVRTQRVERCG
jgi:hypothetical protein